MASRIWISRDGDMSAAGSWSGGAVPVNGDEVIFDPAFSEVAASTGLDFATGGVTFGELFIAPGWKFPIGSYGNPLKAESDVIRHYGNCMLSYESKNAGVENDTKDTIVDTAFKGPACMFSKSGSSLFTRLRVHRGNVHFDTSTTPIKAYIGHPGRPVGPASLTLNSTGSGGGIRIILFNGRVYANLGSATGIGVAEIYDGVWTQEAGGAVEMNVHGGRVIYDSVDASTLIIVDGGMLDTSQTSRTRTLTAVTQFAGEFVRSPQTAVGTYKDLRLQRRWRRCGRCLCTWKTHPMCGRTSSGFVHSTRRRRSNSR